MDADPGARTKSLSSPILEKKKKRRKKSSETTDRKEKVNSSEIKSVAIKSLDFSAEKVGSTSQAVVHGIPTTAKTCKIQKCSGVASRDSAASAGKDSGAAVVLGSVSKIQDSSSSSCYDSGARGRVRQIEEQTALSLALHYQRLQNRSARDFTELHLREPREQEIRITLAPKQEPVAQQVDIEFPELTAKMEQEINRALFGGSRDEAVSDGFHMTVTRSDMLTLHGLNWLNDEIINFYFNLIMERSKEKGSPKIHAFSTFFFQKLKNAGYNSIRRWTRNVNIFSMDILLIPIHLGAHWCLAVIDFRKKTITYYDSMAGSQDETCRILLEYLKQESQEKRGLELDADGWILTSMKSQDIPQQRNGSDCGMFSCKYAEYISRDREISFTQHHMPYFRKRMVWEILHKKLL